jgi:hypothetical protein
MFAGGPLRSGAMAFTAESSNSLSTSCCSKFNLFLVKEMRNCGCILLDGSDGGLTRFYTFVFRRGNRFIAALRDLAARR